MRIKLNGEETEITAGTTLLDILNDKNIDPGTIIAEVDEVILKPEEFGACALLEGSVVEILKFVGGG